MTRRSRGGGRHYPRTARLNKLFQEILAEELERIDDDRLDLVTVMEVDVDAELSRAILYYMVPHDRSGSEAATALDEHRLRLQGALGRQARIRRVPELVLRPDEVSESAARIEAILRDLPETAGADEVDDDATDPGEDGDSG